MEYSELTKAFKQVIRILLEFHGTYSPEEVSGLLAQHFKESPYQPKCIKILQKWERNYNPYSLNGNYKNNSIIRTLYSIENEAIQQYFERTPAYIITERLSSRFYKETCSQCSNS